MYITGFLKDTLKEEFCVVPTTFSDSKKDDHKPGKSRLSEVSLIGCHVPYCVRDYNRYKFSEPPTEHLAACGASGKF